MSAIAEIRASSVYKLNQVLEYVIPPMDLQFRVEATLDSAREWDRNKGNFAEAANEYYSVYTVESNPEDRLEGLFGLTQELINMGKFKQARNFLRGDIRDRIPWASESSYKYAEAKIPEQIGWICDIELGFDDSRDNFSKSMYSLERKGKENWDDKDRILFSTDNHFSGRAHFGLAGFGIDKDTNLRRARIYFEEALRRDEIEVDAGKADTDKLGFGYSWIARCDIRAGDFDRAEMVIDRSTDLFNKHVEVTGRAGVMAYAHLLRGELFLAQGKPRGAREEMEEAVRLRTVVEPYAKGLADAYLGISSTYLQEGNVPVAIVYGAKAFLAHPYASYRGMLGG